MSRSIFALAILGLAACGAQVAPRPLPQPDLATPCGVVTPCAIPPAKYNPLPTAYTNAIPISRWEENQSAFIPAGDPRGHASTARR
jgi:hypothetical protein